MDPILVTGAAGSIGAVGRTVVELLRGRDLPVRALVRREDERSAALRATGAEVVTADLTLGADVVRAMAGCRRVYFGMSVSAAYLQATTVVAAAARAQGDLEALVNMSQMTVSQMSLTSTTESTQQRLQWLGEAVLDWSALPVVNIRPTVFVENPLFRLAAGTVARNGEIRLPFGDARTSPVAAADVAAVVATVLADPAGHVGHVYELTGPRSQTMSDLAAALSATLGRPVRYTSVPLDSFCSGDLRALGLPDHVFEHVASMARLHAEGRYDRATDDLPRLLGRPATPAASVIAGMI